MIQKTLFLAEELGGASRPPTEDELRAYLASHPERFTLPPRIRFRHIFARRPEGLPSSPAPDDPGGGEVSPVGPGVDAELPWIEQRLGAPFGEALSALAPGAWSRPIRSAFGWHLVRVVSRIDGRPARLEDVRARVIEQFQVSRRQDAVAAYLAKAFGNYRVDIDGHPVSRLSESGRVAQRSVPSAED